MKADHLTLDARELPSATGSKLYSDFVAGEKEALVFYSFHSSPAKSAGIAPVIMKAAQMFARVSVNFFA